ncbi:UDP-glucosyltransferase 2-like [Prorops nasuta]|uniref:UDP-glucosyltransferase 2-like n=1 Tax=Prorops nasuta TaxID=863751 RepID=UPI0034CD2DE6
MKNFLAFGLVYLVFCQVANSYRILALFPLNGKSHSVMTHALTKGLAKRGHQIDVVSHFPLKKPISNYRDISIKGTVPSVVNNVSANDVAQFHQIYVKYFVEMAGTKICRLLGLPQFQQLIKYPPIDPPYDLIITEVFVTPCYLAFGQLLNIPVIGVVACWNLDWLNYPIGNPLNPAYMPSLFSTYTQNMNFFERLANTFMTTAIISQVNYYFGYQDKIVQEYFGPGYPSVNEMQKNLSLILVNSHRALNGIRPLTQSVVEVAGLHLEDEQTPLPVDVQKWLDDGKDGVIYVAFGSMVRLETFPPKVVQEFYGAFEKVAPVRILMKVAKKEELLPGLPKNVMTKSWFNQISVLRHKNIKAFITHGGLMGTQESVYCGVPMIGIPFFADQHVNIKVYAKRKIVIAFESIQDVTTEKLADAIQTIINDPTYSTNVKIISKQLMDRPMSAMDTAIYWIEYIGRHGATSLQSPAIHLSWWQRYLLDILALILVTLFAAIKILCFVVKKVECFIFGTKCSKRESKALQVKKNK